MSLPPFCPKIVSEEYVSAGSVVIECVVMVKMLNGTERPKT